MNKTMEIKAIDKEKAIKRASNILGLENLENLEIEAVEKIAPHKKFFGLLGTEPGVYEVIFKDKIIIKNNKHKEVENTIKEKNTNKINSNINTVKENIINKTEKKIQKYTELEEEILNKVKFFIDKMKLDVNYKLKKVKDKNYVVNFNGKDNALLIGAKGKTLNSLEYLLNNLIKDCKIELDVENFKEKRNETLRSLGKKMADKVSRNGKTIRLNAMPPRERKIIHEVINKYPDLETTSEGRDPKRYIVIKKKR